MFILYKKEITDFLISFLTQKQQELEDSHFSKDIFERLMPLATSGKMFRGSLLINTYEKLSGRKYSQEVLQAAAALELAGTSFLIHDDIIDQDNLRRGQETLHHQYKNMADDKKYQNSKHFGESLAICVGDLVFFLVYELLPMNLVKLFSQQLSITALGEMHDAELALKDGKKMSKEEILQMYMDKTASYTVSLPLMAGVTLANQSEEVIAQLNELGKILGLIFQIKDDELGLFGDEKKIGKPVGADIREGKKTLYYYYLLQKVEDKDGLLQVFGNSDLADAQISKVMSLIKNYQVRQKVEQESGKLRDKAKKQIKNLLVNSKMRLMIIQFLDIVANRVR